MSMVNEAELVDGWRAERFFRMGFEPAQVDLLIRWGTSPADVEPWIDGGCPPEVALRIAAPLEEPVVLPVVEHAELYSVS